MSESIVHLGEDRTVDPRGFLRGAWREIAVRRLSPGDRIRLVAEDAEHAVYVWRGGGTLTLGEGARPVAGGTGVTICLGAEVWFESGDEGLTLFVVTLAA